MLWKFLRVILSTYFTYYFRRFKGKNIKNIRVDGPVLLSVNHPNAFVDSICLSIVVFNPRTYYMARGDAFKKGFVTNLLTAIGIIPIFRMRDGGIEGVKKNNASFAIVNKMWNKNQKIMVFSEGLCVQERRLRPIQKGTARMAFGFSEEFKRDDLVIVPVSVTYSHPSQFGTDIYYHAGEAIKVKDYLSLYNENQAKAVNQLTKNIEEKMLELTPHLNNKDNDALIEELQEIYKIQYLEENKLDLDDLDDHQKFWFYITKQLNLIEENSVERITHLRQLAYKYTSLLKIKKLKDSAIYNHVTNRDKSSFVLVLSLILLFPFYLIGKTINFLPKFLAKTFADKKVKNIEFYASINYGSGAVFAFLFMIIELLVIWFVFKIWWLLPIYFVAKLVFGKIAIFYSRFKKEAFASVRFNGIKGSDPKLLEELLVLRKEILLYLTSIK
ncbi:MAG: 1-acyl-sn-glycerol-3-phosphate acyltransferase [Bacteroidetes bacterium]|nr:1-acyl-sn-glycerol-3-phosphate acyltransferase [Bacteroidota bacterium]